MSTPEIEIIALLASQNLATHKRVEKGITFLFWLVLAAIVFVVLLRCWR